MVKKSARSVSMLSKNSNERTRYYLNYAGYCRTLIPHLSYFSYPHNTCVHFRFIIVMETLINPVFCYSICSRLVLVERIPLQVHQENILILFGVSICHSFPKPSPHFPLLTLCFIIVLSAIKRNFGKHF